MLDQSSGDIAYKSVHFNVTLKVLSERLKSGYNILVDIEKRTIRFKRPAEEQHDDVSEHSDIGKESTRDHIEEDDIGKLKDLLPDVLKALKAIGRCDDFISVIESVASGKLDIRNMALHLLLDVGRFLKCQCRSNMRYSQTSLDFWLIVQKLFKGKAVRFFRGLKSDDNMTSNTMDFDHSINFAVPSDRILQRESDKFRLDVKNPGLIRKGLEAFAAINTGNDCKVSFDGKKIAYGFGRHLGEEDLSGFEEAPTLKDRQCRLQLELEKISVLQDDVSEMMSNSLNDMDEDGRIPLSDSLKGVITILSKRLSELRYLSIKKKRAVQNIIAKINIPWRESSVAQVVSFLQTQVIQCDASIHKLLQCIDDLCFFLATINGTQCFYKRGLGIEVNLQKQGNYVCLHELDAIVWESMDPKNASAYIKQRSEMWHKIRDGASVTGSSLYKALGFDTLKLQKQYFDKAYKGTPIPVSAELQEKFTYGSNTEIHAVATLVSKIMPAYFPHLIFREDGCVVLPMYNSNYAVISGDGTGVNGDKEGKVAFELKCPIPGKVFTPDVYYTLPVYYSTQILSQMASKKIC